MSGEMADNPSAQFPSENEEEEIIQGYESIASFTQSCFGNLVKATQQAHALPNPGDDYEFYTSFPDFLRFCKTEGLRTLNNIGRILKFQQISCNWPSGIDHDNSGDTDDIFESLVEANDILLEHIDSCLDEASGLKQNKKPVLPQLMEVGSPVVSSWNKVQNTNEKVRFLHARNILRPQLRFKEKVDNSNTPFVASIKEKPNALKPLEDQIDGLYVTENDSNVPKALANMIREQRMGVSSNYNVHPYKFELEQFGPEPDDMEPVEVTMYKPLEETELIFINTVEALTKLVDVLKNVQLFAVDLEAHSFRSFQGITCLMQISTRDHDYLIDTLELRSELSCLNTAFTDPKILKVMHGADMDIGWLQRDFGIYVVNMFDTGQATRVLEYPRFSLAFLLKKFCDVTANKQYQLADWRIRPLPAELELYAREDTHYLLYIYERLRNELVAKGNENNNLLQSVYKRSTDVCLKVYKKPIFTDKSYLDLYHKHKKSFNNNQLEAFRLLYAWRDGIARVEDESCAYVLPNHMLFTLAEALPKEPQGVIACCNPVPSLVRQNINEIHRLIVKAREATPTMDTPAGASMQSVSQEAGVISPSMHVDESPLRRRGQTLDENLKGEPKLAFKDYPITGPVVNLSRPVIGLFVAEGNDSQPTIGELKAEKIKASFENPFLKFLPAKKFTEITGDKASNATNGAEGKTNVSDDAVEVSHRYTEAAERYTKIPSTNELSSKSKKRKQDDSDEGKEVALRAKKQKKKSKTKSRNNNNLNDKVTPSYSPTHFHTFDYDNVTLDVGKQEATAKEDFFNPYKKLKEKGRKLSSKVHRKSGGRTMTFSKN